MNAYLNYLLEASIGLCLFLVVYQLLLRKETNFRFNRIFLLIGLGASVLFPLIKLPASNSPVPSLNLSVQPAATEADLIYSQQVIPQNTWTTWEVLTVIYTIGLALFFLVFAVRLGRMIIALRASAKYNLQNHHIVELSNTSSSFSFFNYIFIGSTPPLTESEKQQIIEHERIHAKLFHSVDIVLLNILGIVFWFNPVIRVYKKIFVQLHEFEADARAVEIHDVNEYCSLLARVALHSANYRLANHFSNSLTVKRIEMMRAIKQKIRSWKMIAVAAFVPMLFFAISCQDQVSDIVYTEKDGRVPVAIEYSPEPIEQRIDALNKANPDRNYVAVDITEYFRATEQIFDDHLAFRRDIKKYNLPEIVEMRFEYVDDPKSPERYRSYAVIDLNQRSVNPASVRTKQVPLPNSVREIASGLKAKFPKRHYKIFGPSEDAPEVKDTDPRTGITPIVFQGIIWGSVSHETVRAKDKKGDNVYYLILEIVRGKKLAPEEIEEINKKNPGNPII
ncbi:MAG: hypothetical protein JNK18_01855 [Cyclobacteriaceae bacterium]|nr:hypothetical protein [Cyclobacteriaceae bacterium]